MNSGGFRDLGGGFFAKITRAIDGGFKLDGKRFGG